MEKEVVKQKIRALSKKIKEAEEDWEWESYEMDIAKLIIDYSMAHSITIPLIDYDRYKALFDQPKQQESLRAIQHKRPKIDQEGDVGDPEYAYMDDFFEAIGEETVINPRFRLHPEIKELVECWDAAKDGG